MGRWAQRRHGGKSKPPQGPDFPPDSPLALTFQSRVVELTQYLEVQINFDYVPEGATLLQFEGTWAPETYVELDAEPVPGWMPVALRSMESDPTVYGSFRWCDINGTPMGPWSPSYLWDVAHP